MECWGVKIKVCVSVCVCVRANSGFTAKGTLEKDFLEWLLLRRGWHEPSISQGFE